MFKFIKPIVLLVFFIPGFAGAFTECNRPVNLIYNSLTGSPSVWITFSDGGSAVFQDESQLTEGQMARFVSFALAAQASGRSLFVRYPENGLQCPPTGAARNDIEGFWILPD